MLFLTIYFYVVYLLFTMLPMFVHIHYIHQASRLLLVFREGALSSQALLRESMKNPSGEVVAGG
jgi:hypothetical protein